MKIDKFFVMVMMSALVYMPLGYGALQKEGEEQDVHGEHLAVPPALFTNPPEEATNHNGAKSEAFVSSPTLFVLMLKAIEKGKVDGVRAGLETLASNKRDVPAFLNKMRDKKTGATALMVAARQGNEQIVAELLKKGANSRLKDLLEQDVFHYVVKAEDPVKRAAIFKQLLSAKDIGDRGKKEVLLMERSVRTRDETLLQLLVSVGMPANLMSSISAKYVPALNMNTPIRSDESPVVVQVHNQTSATSSSGKKGKRNKYAVQAVPLSGKELEREQLLADASFRALGELEAQHAQAQEKKQLKTSKKKKRRDAHGIALKPTDEPTYKVVDKGSKAQEQSPIQTREQKSVLEQLRVHEEEDEEKKAGQEAVICLLGQANSAVRGPEPVYNQEKTGLTKYERIDGEVTDDELINFDDLEGPASADLYTKLKAFRHDLTHAMGTLQRELTLLQGGYTQKQQQEHDALMMKKAKEFEARHQALMRAKEEEEKYGDSLKLVEGSYDECDDWRSKRYRKTPPEVGSEVKPAVRRKMALSCSDFIASRTRVAFEKQGFKPLGHKKMVVSAEQQRAYDLAHCHTAVHEKNVEALCHFMQKANLGAEDQKPFLNDMLGLVIEKDDYNKANMLLEMGADLSLVADIIRNKCRAFNQEIADGNKERVQKGHPEGLSCCMQRANLPLEERQPILNVLLEQLFNHGEIRKSSYKRALHLINCGANPAYVEDKIRSLAVFGYKTRTYIEEMHKRFCLVLFRDAVSKGVENIDAACGLLEQAGLSLEDKQKELDVFLLKLVESQRYRTAARLAMHGANPKTVEELIRATCSRFAAHIHIRRINSKYALGLSHRALVAGDMHQALVLLPQMTPEKRIEKLREYLEYTIMFSAGEQFGNVMPLIAAGAPIDKNVCEMVYKKYDQDIANDLIRSMKSEHALFLSRVQIAQENVAQACNLLVQANLPLDGYQREIDSFFLRMVEGQRYDKAISLIDYGANPSQGYDLIRGHLSVFDGKEHIEEMGYRRLLFLSNQAMVAGNIDRALSLLVELPDKNRLLALNNCLIAAIANYGADRFDIILQIIAAGATVEPDIVDMVYRTYQQPQAEAFVLEMQKGVLMYLSHRAIQVGDVKNACVFLKNASLSLRDYQRELDSFLSLMITNQEYEKAFTLIERGANCLAITEKDLSALEPQQMLEFMQKMKNSAALFSSKAAMKQGRVNDACALLQDLPYEVRQGALNQYLKYTITSYKNKKDESIERVMYMLIELGARFDQEVASAVRNSCHNLHKERQIICNMTAIAHHRNKIRKQ